MTEIPAVVRLLRHMSDLWKVAQHFDPAMLSREGPTSRFPVELRQAWGRRGGLRAQALRRRRAAA